MIDVIQPAWNETRERVAFAGLLRRRRHRRLARAAAVVFALALVGVRLWPSSTVHFADGSTAELIDADSAISESPPATAHLTAGGARFDVRHDERRRFRVEAGEVVVEDLGTRFTVQRIGSRVGVSVDEGRVRVSWPGDTLELGAGQSGVFPPDDAVSLLLREADRARRQGRPEEALAPLRQIVDAHAGDPRAPLAAFTLGRVYLDELHRPADAAAAFARARALDPDGPLAADARNREREARGGR
jgi:transmembrane sensor